MTYRLITPPAVLPVTLADVKLHLRIDDNDLDAVVTAWIAGVTTFAEHWTGRAFIHQTWRVAHDRFPTAIRIPRSPASSVVALRYLDEAGVEQILDPGDYDVDTESEPGWIVPAPGKAWPTTFDRINAVKADVICGYGATAASVPDGIKLYLIAKIVEQFDAGAEIKPDTVRESFIDRQLDPFTLREFG